MPFKEIPNSHGLKFHPIRHYAEILNVKQTIYVLNFDDIQFQEGIIDYLKCNQWDFILINDTDQPAMYSKHILSEFYEHIPKDKTFRITGDTNYLLHPEENTLFFPYYQYCFLEGIRHPMHLPFWKSLLESDSSILIKTRNYSATCLNNIARYHRFLVLDQLVDKPYFNKILYSFNNNVIDEDHNEFEKLNYERILAKVQHLLPIVLDKHGPGSPHLFPKVIHDQMLTNDHVSTKDAYLNIVLENTYICSFLSEKTWKAVSSGQFFTVLGGTQSVSALRELGYDVFDDLIDHSYDTETDLYKRVDMLISSIDQFMQLDHAKIWEDTYYRRLGNVQKFFSVDLSYNPIKELLKNIL